MHQACLHLRLFRLRAQNTLSLDVHPFDFLLSFRSLKRSIPLPCGLRYLSHSFTHGPIAVLWRIAIQCCSRVVIHLPFGINLTGGRTMCVLFSCSSSEPIVVPNTAHSINIWPECIIRSKCVWQEFPGGSGRGKAANDSLSSLSWAGK